MAEHCRLGLVCFVSLGNMAYDYRVRDPLHERFLAAG